MSLIKPWRAGQFGRVLGNYESLAEARQACDAEARGAPVRASVVNARTGERWFRRSIGWTQTALVQERVLVVRDPSGGDRD